MSKADCDFAPRTHILTKLELSLYSGYSIPLENDSFRVLDCYSFSESMQEKSVLSHF